MLKRFMGFVGLLLILACSIAFQIKLVHADSILQSNNYKLDETIVGAGGLDNSSSSNYQISIGHSDLAIGESASSNYIIEAGSKTTPDPTLSFIVGNANANFTTFSPNEPSTATASFSVINYTSSGYIVQIFGDPPTYGDHTITAIATPFTSSIGQEQFGINLVANTIPASFGANPDNGQFGFGSVTENYNSDGYFRYEDGGTIAMAQKSSGLTVYTISYLVNVASITPGGQYTSNQTLVIVGTY